MEPTPPTAECEGLHDDLAVLAIGALTGHDRARILSHLEGCPSCAAEMEELSAAADALATLIPEAEPDEGFSERTMAVIRAEQPGRQRPLVRRFAAVAAVVVLLAVGGGTGAVVASSLHDTPASRALDGSAPLDPGGGGYRRPGLVGAEGLAGDESLRCADGGHGHLHPGARRRDPPVHRGVLPLRRIRIVGSPDPGGRIVGAVGRRGGFHRGDGRIGANRFQCLNGGRLGALPPWVRSATEGPDRQEPFVRIRRMSFRARDAF